MEIVIELTQKVIVKMKWHNERETLRVGAKVVIQAQYMVAVVL